MTVLMVMLASLTDEQVFWQTFVKKSYSVAQKNALAGETLQ